MSKLITIYEKSFVGTSYGRGRGEYYRSRKEAFAASADEFGAEKAECLQHHCIETDIGIFFLRTWMDRGQDSYDAIPPIEKISTFKPSKESQAKLREAALAKLTPLEREALCAT